MTARMIECTTESSFEARRGRDIDTRKLAKIAFDLATRFRSSRAVRPHASMAAGGGKPRTATSHVVRRLGFGVMSALSRTRPIVLLSEATKLVPATLERTLRQRAAPYKDGWTDAARERGLLVDLSRVGWVELEAVVQLCLLVESARCTGVAVDVALPLTRKLAGELERERPDSGLPEHVRGLISAQAARRRDVLEYLDYLRFSEALAPPHLGPDAAPLRLLDDGETATDAPAATPSGGSLALQARSLAGRSGNLFKLTWITCTSDPELERLANHMADVVAADGRGTQRIEAATIADVVLHELVDNALRHARAAAALIAAFAWTDGMSPQPNEYVTGVQPFMSWLASAPKSGVEVVVGDSGLGVAPVLRETYERVHGLRPGRGAVGDVLAWAFDRDSTSNPERTRSLTRGLYRVHRVVRSHSGLVTLRSANQLAGWDHGGPGHDKAVTAGQRLSTLPGTVLRTHLCPIAVAVVPRLEQPPAQAPRFRYRAVAVADDGRLDAPSRDTLATALAADREGCVVVPVASGRLGQTELETLLAEVAEVRDPAAVALVLDGPWDVVENACDAVNQEVDRDRERAREENREPSDVTDPVLVLSAHDPLDRVAWAGTTTAVAAVLSRLVAAPTGRLAWAEADAIASHDGVELDRPALRGILSREMAIVAGDEDGIALRVTPTAVFDAVADEVGRRLDRHLKDARPHDTVRTRSLIVVRRWLSASRLIEEGADEVAALAALAARVQRTPAWAERPAQLVVADANVSGRRLARLCEALGIGGQHVTLPSERGSETLDRLRILDADIPVLVYADVMASGESVRRCLTQLLRDRAAPTVVATLFDGRADRGSIEAHEATIDFSGQPLPVVALVAGPLQLDPVPPTVEPRNVGSGGRTEAAAPERPTFAIEPDRLLPLIEERDALHFRHVGEPGGRHFTFYVDAKKLLDAPQLLDALAAAVADWRADDDAGRPLEVWHPTPEPKPSEPAATLAKDLAAALGAVRHAIRREPLWDGWTFEVEVPHPVEGRDVVLVDWGALDGTTVTQMVRLAAEAGARRVLACICLSQLAPQAEWHLGALRSVRVKQPDPSEEAADTSGDAGAQTTMEDSASSRRRVLRDVPVEVRFLSAVPVTAFGPRECPVCEQLSQLELRENADDLPQEWAKQRHRRLRLQGRQETVNASPIDVNDIRLTGAQAVEMLRFRRDLEAALRSTASRHAVQKEVEQFADTKGAPRAKALALLRFLAIETQWLRRPPLVLGTVRDPVARLAAAVAEADDVADADRGNAMLVLRLASPELFAESLDAIFSRVYADRSLVAQLLHGVEAVIERPYPRSEQAWEPLVRALKAMRKQIDDGAVPEESPGVRDVRSLADRALGRQRRAAARELGAAQAWSRLKVVFDTEYYRHGVGAAVRRLYPHQYLWWEAEPGTAGDDRRRAWAQLLLPSSWERIEGFLTTEVLPLLSRLHRPLGSAVAREALGREFAGRLLDDLERHWPVSRWELAHLARDVAAGRQSLADSVVRRRYEREYDLLLRSLLDADDDEASPSSGLIRLAADVPAELYAEVTQAAEAFYDPLVGEPDCSGVADDGTLVLLPRSALQTLLFDVLENVAEHHASHCGGEREPAAVQIATRREGDAALLTIRNTGTCGGVCDAHPARTDAATTDGDTDDTARARESAGLAKHERDLDAFDGELDWGHVDDGSATTFEVTARLAVST
jgi:orotate phosphoribosyltransferase